MAAECFPHFGYEKNLVMRFMNMAMRMSWDSQVESPMRKVQISDILRRSQELPLFA
jgi:hypothetical protein